MLYFSKQTLEKHKETYRQLRFETMFFKETGVKVLKDTQLVADAIDELLTKVVSISSSKYAKYLQKEIGVLWGNLQRAQEYIDIWAKVQKLFCQQLQIFVYEDIRKQLTNEYSKFQQVFKTWEMNVDVKF